MANFQKVQRTFEEQYPPCRNCETSGKICMTQLTPSKSAVCLECCNRGLEQTCSIVFNNFGALNAFPQLPDDFVVVAAESDRRTLITNDTDYFISNPNAYGIVVSCNLCSKHSVTIREFGLIKLCSDCIESIPGLQSDIHYGQTNHFNPTGQALETSILPSSDNVQSSSLRSKLKCDRCSVKRISCSHTFPCDKCNTDGAICSVSARRRRYPGTCGECVRRKIPCVGNGNVCYACECNKTADLCRPLTRPASNSTPDDNNSSNSPSKKRGREDTSDDKGDHESMAATSDYDGSQNQWNFHVKLRKALEGLVPLASIYLMKDCEIGDQIGRGGSMLVFEGTCNIAGTEIKVAFKRPHMEKIDFRRLVSVVKRELTIMEQLKQNSNIVNLCGLTFDQSTPILIVELAKCSLDRYLSGARQRSQPISWTEKLRLCCNVCEGLLALHRAEIVHGDIKAGNVLVFIDKDDGTSIAKISDFGFSSTLSSSSNNVGGTPAFAAPECTRLGLRTYPKLLKWKRDKYQDVYSFGLFLWQVAMDGKGPYSGMSRSAIEAAKTEDPELTKLISQLLPGTPPALRKCIQAATKYMPLDRVSLDEIKTLLQDELITLQDRVLLKDLKLNKITDQGLFATMVESEKVAIKRIVILSPIFEQANVPIVTWSKALFLFRSHKGSVTQVVYYCTVGEIASIWSYLGRVFFPPTIKDYWRLGYFQWPSASQVCDRSKNYQYELVGTQMTIPQILSENGAKIDIKTEVVDEMNGLISQNSVNDSLNMTHVVTDAEADIDDGYVLVNMVNYGSREDAN